MQLTTTRPRKALLSAIGAFALVGALFTSAAAADDGDNRHPSGKDRSVEPGGSGTQGRSSSDPDDDGRGPDRSNGGPDKPGGSGGVDRDDQDGNNGCGNDDDFEDDNEGWCGRKPKPAKADKAAKAAPAAPAAGRSSKADYVGSAPCPEGMVDTNGAADGGCERPAPTPGPTPAPECPEGMTDTNGAADGGCECPADMVDTNGATAGGCEEPEGEVLGAGAEADDDDTTTGAPAEGEVLGGTAEQPAEVSARSTGEVLSVGALAFTGTSITVLLAVALGLLALGYYLLRRSRTADADVRS